MKKRGKLQESLHALPSRERRKREEWEEWEEEEGREEDGTREGGGQKGGRRDGRGKKDTEKGGTGRLLEENLSPESGKEGVVHEKRARKVVRSDDARRLEIAPLVVPAGTKTQHI